MDPQPDNEYRVYDTPYGPIYHQDVVLDGVKYRRIERLIPLDAVVKTDVVVKISPYEQPKEPEA